MHTEALLGRLRAGFSHCRLHAQLRGRKAHHGNGRQVRRMGKLQWRQSGKTDKRLNGPTDEQTDRRAHGHTLRMSDALVRVEEPTQPRALTSRAKHFGVCPTELPCQSEVNKATHRNPLAIPSQKHGQASAAIYLHTRMFTKCTVHATHLPK